MLIDEVEITLKAGNGGPGRVSFNPGKYSGPNGGNGGKGGNVWATVTTDLTALSQFARKKFFQAENGESGGAMQKSGQNGDDLVLQFPVGTSLIDKTTGETIVELINQDQRELVCKGGLGGKGNTEFKSSTNTTPMYAQPGLKGQERHLEIILRLIADFGLIGLPSAGKSSILNELTNTSVKTASYPFTTLEPNLGVLNGKVIADIPGLIEGAHEGKGLGIRFLKHVEKVPVLLHCISAESENPIKDYEVVNKELADFNPELITKKEIILLTKSDLVDKNLLKEKKDLLKKLKIQILPVSIYDYESIESLKNLLIML